MTPHIRCVCSLRLQVFYTKTAQEDVLDAALTTVLQIHLEQEAGDILLFLTGQEEIEAMNRLLKDRLKKLPERKAKMKVLQLYASMPPEQQMNIFKPAEAGFRKVILATNIAETSITISGIRYVVDPGL